jgi:hypothetical protein
VLAVALINNHLGFSFAPSGIVYAHKLALFPTESVDDWAILQSSFHYSWAWRYSSTNLALLNYSPSDCFLTFPFPSPWKFGTKNNSTLSIAATAYYEARKKVMLQNQEGLTKTYNRFHDPDEISADIQKLRQLHVEMDQAVAAAYGWTDLDLGHGFHQTKQGLRYTISEPARREVLAHLLKLNHERYAEEVRQGLHEKKGKKAATKKQVANQPAEKEATLFDGEEDE